MRSDSIKFGTFSIAGCTPFAGLVIDHTHVIATEALKEACRIHGQPLSDARTLDGLVENWDYNLAAIAAVIDAGIDEEAAVPIDRLCIHAPIQRPRQIVCTGANYRKHVVDMIVAQGAGAVYEGQTIEERRAAAGKMMDERAANGLPYAWIKSATSLAGPNDVLEIPIFTEQGDWELELAVVISKPGYQVSRTDAMDHVAGYMIANDVTSRDQIYRMDIKALGTDWLASKGAPGYLPTGPFLVPRKQIADPADLHITLKLNDDVMQDETTADMIFDIPRQIEYISSRIQLLPGDIICTGSPAGNGAHHNRYLRDGDVMEGSITGLGTQRVLCRAAAN